MLRLVGGVEFWKMHQAEFVAPLQGSSKPHLPQNPVCGAADVDGRKDRPDRSVLGRSVYVDCETVVGKIVSELADLSCRFYPILRQVRSAIWNDGCPPILNAHRFESRVECRANRRN